MIDVRDTEYLKALGEHIRKLRRKAKFSQEELADRSSLQYSQISRIERGLINPTICTLREIARALSLPLKDLVDF